MYKGFQNSVNIIFKNDVRIILVIVTELYCYRHWWMCTLYYKKEPAWFAHHVAPFVYAIHAGNVKIWLLFDPSNHAIARVHGPCAHAHVHMPMQLHVLHGLVSTL